MLIRFSSEALAKVCNSSELLRRRWGISKGLLLEKRLSQIGAMPNLQLVTAIPGILETPVRLTKKDEFVAAVFLPLRLLFRVDHDPVPLHQNGDARCTEIHNLILMEVIDGGD
jgi:proteic killer suppression protein